ncbi:MAG: hypothetical protein GY940_14490, partial [bacterium]|nr:hypothetical protein [bacterium]
SNIFFNGKGKFNMNPITFNYRSGDINFFKDQSFRVKGEGRVFTDFSDFQLETMGNIFFRASLSPFTLRLAQNKGRYTGDFHVDLTDMNFLIPWGNNKGEVKIDGGISSDNGVISAEGHAVFKGKVLSFPNFPHELENFTGDMIFKDLDFTLRSLRGFMGNGPVESNGRLNIKNNRLDTLFIRINGKNMTLYPMDRATFTLDAGLTINYLEERNKLLLAGDINILSSLWEREVDEGVSFSTNPSLSASGSTVMDML